MVSKRIANVRHQLDVMIMEGITPTLSMLRAMQTILVAAEAGARQLEGAQIPRAQRLTADDLADGKVALFPMVPKLHPAQRESRT